MPELQSAQAALSSALAPVGAFGRLFQPLLAAVALAMAVAVVARLRRIQGPLLALAVALLTAGEVALAWLHWHVYRAAVVVSPENGLVVGRVAVPLWVESEKLYVWALIVAVMALVVRRHREELQPGLLLSTAVLMAGAALWGRPFTDPVPGFFGQYSGYLAAMGSGDGFAAMAAYRGMEGARLGYYNAWFMWVHPPLLFLSYGAFVVSFVAVVHSVLRRHSAYEAQAYWWARLGYLPLTAGMLLGFPWALMSWQGEAWWWSGKVNMSIMMWLLYTAYLHARLYLRRRGMWRWVVALNILSFVVLVLTYLATYVVPGAHSYA